MIGDTRAYERITASIGTAPVGTALTVTRPSCSNTQCGGCRGLTAEDDSTAIAGFESALAAHAAANDALFEQARTELMLGARLRRSGQRVAARTHLRGARDRFASMDLTLWVQRAAGELAATGETARPRRQTGDEPLTSQETRVALLVGQGMTNREVAAALFVSPKTVEHHLSSVYRKRGLRSRSELARAIATDPSPDAHPISMRGPT